jgi:type IV pilus assembly protein PilE
LIEAMIVLTILGIVAAIAYPSYTAYAVRASRAAAQTELMELSSLQEKIYLNSNAFTANMTAAYNGTAAGGLGKITGRSSDNKYALTVTSTGQSYTLTATPVAGTAQADDGAFSISSNGARLCVPPANPKWCPAGNW